MWFPLLALAPIPYVEGAAPPKALPAESLPALVLHLPGLVKANYLDNGHIEVAQLLLQVPGPVTPEDLLHLAQKALKEAIEARPSLAEVDLSLYPAPYAFNTELPLFTASVPRGRVQEFLSLRKPFGYERLWLRSGHAPLKPQEEILEDWPRLEGPEAYRAKEKAEQLLSTRTGFRGSVLYHGNPLLPYAALTFDDAPHPLFTPLLLDLLKRLGLKATFFVIGRNAEAYPYLVRDLVAAGHELGNHTYHHLRLPGLPEEEIRQEILQCNRVLEQISGSPPHLFRPPGGRFNRTVLQVAKDLGLVTVFWTDDPGDYAGLPRPVLESRLLGHLRPGGIILLHDNVLATLRVLPHLAHKAHTRGLTLGPVGGLLRALR
ncbi:polysaccharide deacetylase family protein [Thermus albus]|uniref:polysaccharide deacetylase family protein n=1 Tax=Thermus albus TaxID=2908146 RepID=UPI001FAB0A35|nr:polysaccharide deacetylase family protein [Thermus albus]